MLDKEFSRRKSCGQRSKSTFSYRGVSVILAYSDAIYDLKNRRDECAVVPKFDIVTEIYAAL